MESEETRKTQRSEETEFVEREVELAEKYGVEPKTVRLLRQVVEDVFAEREYEVDIGEFAREQLLAKKFNVPIEKVRQLGDLTAALFERILKEQAEEKAETVQTQKSKQETIEGIKLNVANNVRRELCAYNRRAQHEVLTTILAEVSQITDRADMLITMEDKVRAICDNLDVKTKAFITAIEELSRVEGLSIGVDYGSDIIYETLHDEKYIKAALEENPEDGNLAILAEIYKLSRLINEADSKLN